MGWKATEGAGARRPEYCSVNCLPLHGLVANPLYGGLLPDGSRDGARGTCPARPRNQSRRASTRWASTIAWLSDHVKIVKRPSWEATRATESGWS